ncbi:hypothetical protein BH23PLA1_BH23PLA1_08960 [soil metagenome]
MTRTLLAFAILGTIPILPAMTNADDETGARLISFDALQKRLDEPGVRVLDVRPRADYEAGHIPGAVWVDASAVEKAAGEPGALSDPKRWEDWIAGLGLGPDTEVYVYDDAQQKDAARFWWLLRHLGVETVGLVDGNFPLWKEQGRPVTTETVEIPPRPFPIQLRSDRFADRQTVLRALQGDQIAVVDARSLGEYTGEVARSERGGHIPAACHLEWSELVDEQGRFLPASDLRTKVEKLGLKPGQEVITHCQGGGRASVDAFVLERLGHPARNYYLGWSDWGNAEETPIDTGPSADRANKGEQPR